MALERSTILPLKKGAGSSWSAARRVHFIKDIGNLMYVFSPQTFY